MATDLRLLLDECLKHELADEIKKWSAVNAVWVNDSVILPSTEDDALMAEARSPNRILVTEESRLDERKFKICTHPGIIIFTAKKRHSATKADIFRCLMLSGHRKRAKKSVTILKVEDVTFKEMGQSGFVGKQSYRCDHLKSIASPNDPSYCKWGTGKTRR